VTIEILGKNIYDPDVSLEVRAGAGKVFQRPTLLPLSLYENVVFGIRSHNELRALTCDPCDETVERALVEVGPWDDSKDRLDAPVSLQGRYTTMMIVAHNGRTEDLFLNSRDCWTAEFIEGRHG
jgi:phosphate transport system ATP-binding protein